jgi:nitrate/nitrite-specific signal transduction histidine kinase
LGIDTEHHDAVFETRRICKAIGKVHRANYCIPRQLRHIGRCVFSSAAGILLEQPRENRMNNLTIVTKLRFMAALAPAILLIVAAVIASGFHLFGALPQQIYDNEDAAARAAEGMETALYKMDWGRTQADASQIVMDQQRGFISEIEAARQHIENPEQAEDIEKIANEARPLFDAMRTASPTDDSLEPKLRDLQATVADLMSLDDAALIAIDSAAESKSRVMIAITIIALVAVPWICFVVIASLTGNLYKELKEMRRRLEAITERDPSASEDAKALDESLTNLGFPKPNPMLAE